MEVSRYDAFRADVASGRRQHIADTLQTGKGIHGLGCRRATFDTMGFRPPSDGAVPNGEALR